MTTKRLLSGLTALLAVAGCGVDAGIGGAEQAIIEDKAQSIDDSGMWSILKPDPAALDLPDFTLSLEVTPGATIFEPPTRTIVLQPSGPFCKQMYNDDNVAAHSVRIEAPSAFISTSWPLPDVTVYLNWINLDFASAMAGWNDNLRVKLTPGRLVVEGKLTASGHVHLSSFWPDMDRDLEADVHLGFATDGAGHLILGPNPEDVTVKLISLSDCGAFGWCNTFLNDNLPMMQRKMVTALRKALVEKLGKLDAADKIHHAALWTTVETYVNRTTPFRVRPELKYTVAPDTIKLGTASLDYRIHRVVPPSEVPSCTFQVFCNDEVSITCAPNGDTIYVYRQDNASPPDWTAAWVGAGSINLSDYPDSSNDSVVYRLCAQNALGSLCQADQTVTLEHRRCGGGSGSGGRTGCTKTAKNKTGNCYSTGS